MPFSLICRTFSFWWIIEIDIQSVHVQLICVLKSNNSIILTPESASSLAKQKQKENRVKGVPTLDIHFETAHIQHNEHRTSG